MRCPFCNSHTSVLRTTIMKEGTRRRRQCLAHPEHRFTTMESYKTTDGRKTKGKP